MPYSKKEMDMAFDEFNYFDTDDLMWKNILLSKFLNPDKIYDVYVVCAPDAWGGSPFVVCFTEESAKASFDHYYDDSTVQMIAKSHQDAHGEHPGAPKIIKVPMQSLRFLALREVTNESESKPERTEG
jgi:hypothetical protein